MIGFIFLGDNINITDIVHQTSIQCFFLFFCHTKTPIIE